MDPSPFTRFKEALKVVLTAPKVAKKEAPKKQKRARKPR